MSNVIKSPNVNLKFDDAYTIVHKYKVKDKSPEENKTYEKEQKNKLLKQELIKQQNDIKLAKEKADKEIEILKANAFKQIEQKALEIEEQSKQQGYEKGLEQVERDCKTKQEQANNILDQAKKEKEQIISNLEPKLVKLIENIVKKIIHNEMRFNNQSIIYLIKNGLGELKSKKNIVIKVSEEDYDTAKNNIKNLYEDLDTDCKVDILKESKLKLGGCIIETDYGAIDCSIDKQLKKLHKELSLLYGDNDE